MNLPQNILLEHRWIANPASAKSRAIFFGIIALLLMLFTIYAFSGVRQAVWESSSNQIIAKAVHSIETTPPTHFFRYTQEHEAIRIGIWNYRVLVWGTRDIALHPIGFFAQSFFAPHVLADRSAMEMWLFSYMLGRDAYRLTIAAFALASLYCTIIHRRGGNLPPDAYAKLCK